MTRLLAAALLTLVVSPLSLTAQGQPGDTSPGPRRVSLTLGVGNSMGWLGGQVERYLSGERLSVFGGLGYTPAIDSGNPSGLTAAAGIRGFTGGENHRGFLELSITQIGVTQVSTIYGAPAGGAAGERYYGPGIEAGYQYVSDHGITFLVSAGVGRASGVNSDVMGSRTQPLFGLGAGYTWR